MKNVDSLLGSQLNLKSLKKLRLFRVYRGSLDIQTPPEKVFGPQKNPCQQGF